ncbi:MAG: hypothetical protein R2844_19015 [Caldilineales bacterium]
MRPECEDEVGTLLKLYELATSPRAREAQAWVLTALDATDYEAFDRQHPMGSPGWQRFNDACGIMELFGVLVKHGLVREEVLFDLFGGIDQLWETASAIIPGMRSALNPRLYENFELLYHRSLEWQNQRGEASH